MAYLFDQMILFLDLFKFLLNQDLIQLLLTTAAGDLSAQLLFESLQFIQLLLVNA